MERWGGGGRIRLLYESARYFSGIASMGFAIYDYVKKDVAQRIGRLHSRLKEEGSRLDVAGLSFPVDQVPHYGLWIAVEFVESNGILHLIEKPDLAEIAHDYVERGKARSKHGEDYRSKLIMLKGATVAYEHARRHSLKFRWPNHVVNEWPHMMAMGLVLSGVGSCRHTPPGACAGSDERAVIAASATIGDSSCCAPTRAPRRVQPRLRVVGRTGAM